MHETVVIEGQKKRLKKFNYFIGIDISKSELDYAILYNQKILFHREARNEPEDILAFVSELKKLSKFSMTKSVFCMEKTGVYGNHLLNCLRKMKANIVVENPLQIRNSIGLIRGKYDKIDSIRIAQYAEKNITGLRFWKAKRPIMYDLAALFSLRNKMTTLQTAFKTRFTDDEIFLNKKIQKSNGELCQNTIEAIKSDLLRIGSGIDDLIESDSRLKRLMQIITSVPNIGKITAIAIIHTTNEFIDINCPKKFACYAGVAPFLKESGTFKGKAKVSKIANRKIKSLLHVCAISASWRDAELKAYYIKKTKVEGKHKMTVINAIRNKLILRVFACVKQDKLYTRTN